MVKTKQVTAILVVVFCGCLGLKANDSRRRALEMHAQLLRQTEKIAQLRAQVGTQTQAPETTSAQREDVPPPPPGTPAPVPTPTPTKQPSASPHPPKQREIVKNTARPQSLDADTTGDQILASALAVHPGVIDCNSAYRRFVKMNIPCDFDLELLRTSFGPPNTLRQVCATTCAIGEKSKESELYAYDWDPTSKTQKKKLRKHPFKHKFLSGWIGAHMNAQANTNCASWSPRRPIYGRKGVSMPALQISCGTNDQHSVVIDPPAVLVEQRYCEKCKRAAMRKSFSRCKCSHSETACLDVTDCYYFFNSAVHPIDVAAIHPQASYISTARVSFVTDGKKTQEYASLSLLDDKFVSVGTAVMYIRYETHEGHHAYKTMNELQDCRVFAFSTATFVSCFNLAQGTIISRLSEMCVKGKCMKFPGPPQTRPPLSVTTKDDSMTVSMSNWSVVSTPWGRGKNFNFFEINGEIWVEFMLIPHKVCRLNSIHKPQAYQKLFDETKCVDGVISADSGTPFDVYNGRLRGGGCCLPVEHPSGKERGSIMIGVGHQKVGQNQKSDATKGAYYTHFFYAFNASSEDSFRTVAISQDFCFDDSQVSSVPNQTGCLYLQWAASIDWFNSTHVVIGYGQLDRDSRVITIPAAMILASFPPRYPEATPALLQWLDVKWDKATWQYDGNPTQHGLLATQFKRPSN